MDIEAQFDSRGRWFPIAEGYLNPEIREGIEQLLGSIYIEDLRINYTNGLHTNFRKAQDEDPSAAASGRNRSQPGELGDPTGDDVGSDRG